MNLIEMKGLHKEVEQNINRLLDDFSERTGLIVSDLDFNHIDITSLLGGLQKECLYSVKMKVEL